MRSFAFFSLVCVAVCLSSGFAQEPRPETEFAVGFRASDRTFEMLGGVMIPLMETDHSLLFLNQGVSNIGYDGTYLVLMSKHTPVELWGRVRYTGDIPEWVVPVSTSFAARIPDYVPVRQILE